MNDFETLLKERRSIRNYEDKEVPLETIKKMINQSCLAPSAGNGQPWRFIIINNKDIIKTLSDESKRNLVADMEKNPNADNKKYEAALREPNFNVFYNAPVLVYFIGKKSVESLKIDCTLSACYFMFSALEMGLGTCWIGFGCHIKDPALRHLIGLPDDCQIVAPVIVGYPKIIPEPAKRIAPQILKVAS
jgi:nitroreductase